MIFDQIKIEPQNYLYLAGILPFIIGWIFTFFLRQDLRKQLIIVSIISTPTALFASFLYKDYWQPQYLISLSSIHVGIEDIKSADI